MRRLAVGGMGEVYLAQLEREAGFSKIVAVKRILPHLSDDPAFVAMFNREACIAAQLSHRNVVDIYDYGQHDGAYFIAMEYVGGTDLRTLLDRATLAGSYIPLGAAATIVADACSGLDYAHRRTDVIDGHPLGIVHRDVSPQNLLVSSEGEVKLTDFGLARSAEEGGRDLDGQIQGKFAYMSPEQTRGDDLDSRSDIFSLGILSYELFCGRRPFEGDTLGELVNAIRVGRYPRPSEVRPELPEALDTLLGRALEIAPGDRWQDARAFATATQALGQEAGWALGPLSVAATVAALCPEEARTETVGEGGTQVAAKPIVPDKTVPAAAAVKELARADTDPAPSDDVVVAIEPLPPARRWPWIIAGLVALALIAGGLWVAGRPAEVREWSLEIEPTPATAEVYVDGARVGTGPTVWRSLPGKLNVEVRLAGYKTAKETVVLDERGGVYPLRPVLEAIVRTGRVVVSIDPVGASLTAGEDALTPVDEMAGTYEFDRPEGIVALRAQKAGYVDWQANVLVRAGSTVNVTVKLRPEPVKVVVRGSRKAVGRVVIEAEGFKSECGLPCTQTVPFATPIKVMVEIEGERGNWDDERQVKPGDTLAFVVPVPDPIVEPRARLRAVLSGPGTDGKAARVGLADANVLKRPRGSRRGRIDGVVAVTFRYEYDEVGGLKVTLATDPYSTVSLDGKAIGTTPVVGRLISPGSHRFRLQEHGATVSVKFER